MPLPYTQPGLASLWAAMRTLLDSATMQSVLGGAGRVYLVTDDYSDAEGDDSKPWGRVVITPVQTLWPVAPNGLTEPLPFLIVAELNDFKAKGYNPAVPLEAAQREARTLLTGWAPVLATVRVVLPTYLSRPPQALPLWDEERSLWYTSAEYRAEVAPIA